MNRRGVLITGSQRLTMAIGFMSAVYTLTRFGQNQQITDDIEQLLGHPPRTLVEFLRDSAWRWQAHAWT